MPQSSGLFQRDKSVRGSLGKICLHCFLRQDLYEKEIDVFCVII